MCARLNNCERRGWIFVSETLFNLASEIKYFNSHLTARLSIIVTDGEDDVEKTRTLAANDQVMGLGKCHFPENPDVGKLRSCQVNTIYYSSGNAILSVPSTGYSGW